MNQEEQILNHLLEGGRLTPMDALTKFGCFRLGARIYDLKSKKHSIEKNMIEVNGKSVAEYFYVFKEQQELFDRL